MENYNLDLLLDVLEGRKRFPASDTAKGAEQNPVKLNSIKIEGQALPKKPQFIPTTEQGPESDLGEYSKDAYNEALVPNIADKDMYENLAQKAHKSQLSNEEIMKKIMLNQLERSQSGPKPFKGADIDVESLLSKYGSDDAEAATPYKPDMTSQLIYALGPAALAMATGGSEGAAGGMAAQSMSQKMMEKELDAATKQKAMTKLASGSKLKAIADLAKYSNEIKKEEAASELNVEKFKEEKFKEAVDSAVTMYKEGRLSRDKFLDFLQGTQQDINKMQQAGINKIIESDQKAEDWRIKQKMQEDSLKAAEKRAKIGASAAQVRLQTPTESERKNANIAAALQQGEEAYQRYLKSVGGRPVSLDKKLYDNFKTVLEKADPNTPMSVVLSKIPDEKMRRQIQAEVKWTAAKLRGDSGAAISAGEFVQEAFTHFPRAGEDAATVEEKNAARQQVNNSYKLSAGRAQIAPTVQPKKTDSPTIDRDKDALKYSEMHNMSYEQALQIINLRRGKK